MRKTLKQILSKHGFKGDSLSRVHDFCYGVLEDEKAPVDEKSTASRLMIALAREIVAMERQLQPKAAKPVASRTKQVAENIRLSEVTLLRAG